MAVAEREAEMVGVTGAEASLPTEYVTAPVAWLLVDVA